MEIQAHSTMLDLLGSFPDIFLLRQGLSVCSTVWLSMWPRVTLNSVLLLLPSEFSTRAMSLLWQVGDALPNGWCVAGGLGALAF